MVRGELAEKEKGRGEGRREKEREREGDHYLSKDLSYLQDLEILCKGHI